MMSLFSCQRENPGAIRSSAQAMKSVEGVHLANAMRPASCQGLARVHPPPRMWAMAKMIAAVEKA